MNLQKLFEIQGGLDAHITKEKGLEGQDLLPKKILALQVELGELANEWRGFKFWSENQKARDKVYSSEYLVLPDGRELEKVTNPLLEEYVDCLHFILSIGLDLGIQHKNVVVILKHETILEQFNELYQKIVVLHNQDNLYRWVNVTQVFIGLGEMLGFTEEQIESAYLEKNKINHARQINGY